MFPSLIIPTHNRSPFLARTLASLSRQSQPAFEVVVVDDGSDDDTRDVARSFAGVLDLRYVRRAHKGRAAARNAAIHAARGDLLIFCDDDRLAARDFVRDHATAHAGSDALVALGRQRGALTLWCRDWNIAATAVAGVVAARPVLATRLTQHSAELVSIEDIRERFDEVIAVHGLDEPWWVNYVAPILAEFGPDLAGFAFPWTTGVTGNLSVPRALAERVGLFDESFVGWGLEDADFHFRLHAAGARTRILEGALNHHQLHARPGDQAIEWGRNALRMLEKYDSLELCLYLRIVRRRLSIQDANRIALEYAAAGDAMRAVIAELIRVNKEHFRVLAQAML